MLTLQWKLQITIKDPKKRFTISRNWIAVMYFIERRQYQRLWHVSRPFIKIAKETPIDMENPDICTQYKRG